MNRSQVAIVSVIAVGLMLACNASIFATPTPVPTATPPPTVTPVPTYTPVPTATATAVPVMISSGLLEIPQTYQADLDSGVVPRDPKSPAYADVDLWFDAVSPAERYLEAYNGATMLVMGAAPVGVNECRNIQASVALVDINTLPLGTYICVVTNIQNTSVVRINSIDYSSPGVVRLEFQTWHQP